MKRIGRAYRRHIGRRGTGLIFVTAVFWAYGTGLILGYKPTFLAALGVRVELFGWAWLAIGGFVVTGVLARRDQVQYAVACAAMACWTMFLAVFWQGAYGWTAAISWMGPCLLTLLVSSWPEDPAPDLGLDEPSIVEIPDIASLTNPAGIAVGEQKSRS